MNSQGMGGVGDSERGWGLMSGGLGGYVPG